MSILDRGHVREETLAALASDEQARADLSASERQHLEMCDPCSGLIEGHRLATRALSVSWQFVTAGEVSTGRGVERVRARVSGGLAGPGRISLPIAVLLAVLLLSALIGAGLFLGASRPSLATPPAVYAGPTEAAGRSPSISPRPSPGRYVVDTSTWSLFTSARHGYTISYPPLWTAVPARTPWNLALDGSPAFDSATDAFVHFDPATAPGAWVAVYGMALPTGMTYADFIEKHRAPDRSGSDGAGCVQLSSEWEPITIDGHQGELAQGCGYQEATVVSGGRVYVFDAYENMSVNRPLFEALLSTVRLEPGAADDTPVDPSPAPR